MEWKIIFLLITVTNLTMGKPLCDSLEEYFRKSKQPGAKRLKKTVNRICTAFDVLKYPGVDPLDLILPPTEDDDDFGISNGRGNEEPEEDLTDDGTLDYEFGHEDEALLSDANFRFPSTVHRWPLPPRRFRPMTVPPRLVWRVSDRRQHKVKTGESDSPQAMKDYTTKSNGRNSTSTSMEVTDTSSSSSMSSAVTVTQNSKIQNSSTEGIIDENEYVDDEIDDEVLDDDSDSLDPVLNDLADFVASVRFLSLNDTSHLNVIFPPTKGSSDSATSHSSDKSSFVPPSLAIEAPDDLLPPGYRIAFPSEEDKSKLPQVYRIRSQFTCENQRFTPGFYADTDTDCQAFHLCLPLGHGFKSATFLCPGNLRYSQKFLRCEWTRNVNCSQSSIDFNKNKYFGHNVNTYLQSLHTLLHGDVLDGNEKKDQVTTKKPTLEQVKEVSDNVEKDINAFLLGKLRSIIESE